MPSTSSTTSSTTSSNRIAAIDWMRGLVMVLMAVDHASLMWNSGRVAADSAYLLDPKNGGPLWIAGTHLDTLQFYTRWVTHLCAPTFLFLSGTSLAMSLEKRRAQGMSDHELDRHLLSRAIVLFAFEGLLSLLSGGAGLFLQVLFAIGASMVAMVFLRRLPTALLVALSLGWLGGSEFVLSHLFPVAQAAGNGIAGPVARSVLALLFFVPGEHGSLFVLYPIAPWLAMMLLGWAFGRRLLTHSGSDAGRQESEKLLLLSGLSALLFWAYLRSNNGYGNMFLLRDDKTIVQWLHMSKYPPSLAFSCMELGLMALCLVVFMRHERRMKGEPWAWNPLLIFGQTALFFYMVHFVLLGASAIVLTGGTQLGGLDETYLAATAVIVVLYPVCTGYRAFKRKHPTSVLQYL